MEKGMRTMVNLLDEEQQEIEESKMNKETNDYLICYIFSANEKSMSVKEWEIIKGRTSVIQFIRGILENVHLDVDDSFILVDVDNVSLKDRISIREFIEHVNESENEDDHIVYED